MHQTHQEIIHSFYTAFQNMEAEKMVSLYADHVYFEDPAFGKLHGERARNMWRMLIESQQGKDFRIEFKNVTEHSAHWEAFYTFTPSGRKVHNVIHAQFEIENGKIVRHIDHFNLHSWAKQALGVKGWVLGGTSFFQRKLELQTNSMLEKFEAKKE